MQSAFVVIAIADFRILSEMGLFQVSFLKKVPNFQYSFRNGPVSESLQKYSLVDCSKSVQILLS